MTAYEAVPHPTLRQGDIILAPSIVLVPPEQRDLSAPRRGPERLGDIHRLALWDGAERTASPDVSAELRFSPVLVLSHDCDLEKEFNERVRELMADGVPRDQAVAEAEADSSLDAFAVVAPLRAFSELPDKRHAGVRQGQRIGFFPIVQLPRDGGDYFVDLGQVTTAAVQLLPEAGKVASLSPESVHELRYKLSEAYAIRDLAVLQELERLTGRTIVRATALPKSGKKTSLQLFLDDGDIVHLEIRKPRESLPEEMVRTRPRE